MISIIENMLKPMNKPSNPPILARTINCNERFFKKIVKKELHFTYIKIQWNQLILPYLDFYNILFDSTLNWEIKLKSREIKKFRSQSLLSKFNFNSMFYLAIWMRSQLKACVSSPVVHQRILESMKVPFRI